MQDLERKMRTELLARQVPKRTIEKIIKNTLSKTVFIENLSDGKDKRG